MSAPRRKVDVEAEEFASLPFVSEDLCAWNPPILSGDEVTAYASEHLLGATYAAMFLNHARTHAATDPQAARERLLNIFEQMMGGFPSNIAKGFIGGLGDALAHGAVDLDCGNVWARPNPPGA